jgi:hypothetical protein
MAIRKFITNFKSRNSKAIVNDYQARKPETNDFLIFKNLDNAEHCLRSCVKREIKLKL